VGAGLQQCLGEDARARADLDEVGDPGLDARGGDAARGGPVGEEVLAEPFLRSNAARRKQRARTGVAGVYRKT
jgi:hypothetical protein